MRHAVLLIAALATVINAIMLPAAPNRLPTSWKRSIEGRSESVTEGAEGALDGFAESGDTETRQTIWNPCPELNVKCVLDGDWRNPVGNLGPKRESVNITP